MEFLQRTCSGKTCAGNSDIAGVRPGSYQSWRFTGPAGCRAHLYSNSTGQSGDSHYCREETRADYYFETLPKYDEVIVADNDYPAENFPSFRRWTGFLCEKQVGTESGEAELIFMFLHDTNLWQPPIGVLKCGTGRQLRPDLSGATSIASRWFEQ